MIFLSVFSLFLLAEAKHHDRSNGEHGITMSSQYKTRHIPLIISTWGTEGFINASVNAMKVLRLEGRMKALVTGLATCEENQCDATVGFGGSPDESGETTLDAMVIDAPGMKFGAVADLRRIKYASKVAWAVMNHTKHTLLVATNFAKQMGFQEETLTTRNSRRIHEEWILNNCQPNFWRNVVPNPLTSCGTYNASATLMNDHFNFSNKIDQFNHDTLGMVIVDEHNLISAGTSSNGASHKIPGRVGDSPIPGAGAYANEFGGAAATGDGDVMMRFLPSYETVREMSLGTKPIKAARKALQLILKHYPQFQGAIVAANKNGEVGASCANIHKFAFVVADTAFHTVHTIDCYPYIHQKLYDTVVVSYPKQSFP